VETKKVLLVYNMLFMKEKIDNKERLLELVKEKFFDFGYKSIKTDELAQELGISKRTIYKIFPSKDEMIIEALRLPIIEFTQIIDRIAIEIVEDEKFSFFENLKIIWKLIIDHASLFNYKFDEEIKKYLPQFYMTNRIHTNDRFENIRKLFELGVQKGYLKNNMNIDVFLNVMRFSLSNIVRYDSISNVPLKIEDILKQIFDIVFTGIMTQEGEKKYLESLENN